MNRSPRIEYQINHSDLRGLSRHHADRAKKLKEVCRDRLFWLGDKWSLPASTGAQAALRVLNGSMRLDMLALKANISGTPEFCTNAANRRALAHVSLGFLRVMPRPQLPR